MDGAKVGLAATALLLLAFPFAVADHVMTHDGRSVSFDHRTGNEWWVEVNVGGPDAGTLTRVDAMDTGGAWTPLAKKSWGPYAASFHVEPGHLVRFRVTWSTGAIVESCWFTHPAGVEQCTTTNPPPPPPTSTSSGLSLSGVKGNEWWVEAKATANKPLSAVDTRVNGGTWVPMKLQSWGAWAVSTHAVTGSHVQFRAKATDGSFLFLPNGYTWTQATAFPPGSSTFDARFENVKGNANWVQANVYAAANWGLTGVSFHVDGGPWHPLARQSYGDWTASWPVPDGSFVQFRAESAGQVVPSGTYRWPTASLVPAWPVAGSYATYHVSGGGGSPGGDYYEEYEGTVAFHYSAGAWQATCDMQRHRYVQWETPSDTSWSTHATTALAPPMWPTNVTLGQEVDLDGVTDCARRQVYTQVVGETTVATHQAGAAVTVPAWHSYLDDCGCHDFHAEWARHQGLLLSHGFAGMAAGDSSTLLDTDAPIR